MAASCQKKILFVFCFAVIQCILGVQAYPEEPFLCVRNHTPKLKIDTGYLTIINEYDNDITLCMQSQNCYSCNLIPSEIKKGENCTVVVDTRWPMRVEIRDSNNSRADPPCRESRLSKSFLENGHYKLFVSKPNSKMNCSFPILVNEPVDSNIPIYVAIGIAILLSLFWILMKFLYRNGILHRVFYFWSTEGMMVTVLSTLVFKRDHMNDLGTPTNINAGEDPNKPIVPKKERLRSLDTFRGISILIMVFVNFRGGEYWFFKHSKWNGLHLADLVFPWFVFIMGTSMVFSFSSQIKRKTTKKRMFWKIFKRSVILFGLGLLINSGGDPGGVDLTKFRIPGVLQRLAITYLIIGTIHMFFAKITDDHQYKWWSPVRDVTDYWVEWIVNLVLVAVWIGVTFGLQVPGCPTGYLGPGGLADRGNYTNCTGGAAAYIDSQVLGSAHLYQNPTPKKLYQTNVPYDPEGILGILTSCFMCFLGLQVGKILILYKDWIQRVKRFAIWGIILGIIGAILCKGSQNEGWIPLNKNLWSLSFVLTLSSFGFILFMICYLLIDVWKIWSGAPFFYPGLNAILIYIGHEVFSRRFPFHFKVNNHHPEQLALSIWSTFLWFCIAGYLDYKNIYLTV